MARHAIHFGQLTDRTMNGFSSYRVSMSYGAFTISPQKLPNGAVYFYALKRAKGKLYKAYVGRRGEVTADDVHKATMKVSYLIMGATSGMGRNNQGNGR